jgi:hypothetical protein
MGIIAGGYQEGALGFLAKEGFEVTGFAGHASYFTQPRLGVEMRVRKTY